MRRSSATPLQPKKKKKRLANTKLVALLAILFASMINQRVFLPAATHSSGFLRNTCENQIGTETTPVKSKRRQVTLVGPVQFPQGTWKPFASSRQTKMERTQKKSAQLSSGKYLRNRRKMFYEAVIPDPQSLFE